MRLKAMRTAIERGTKVLAIVAIATAHRARKGLVTVDEYLIDKGVDEVGRKRWSSAFGRKTAQAARAASARIVDTWIVWRGKVTRVFAYVGAVYLGTAWTLYETRIKEG